jgi:HSP20 family protein
MAIRKVSSAVLVTQSAFVEGHDDAAPAHWQPNTDVYVCETGLVVKIELAGMRREDLEIIAEGSRLRVRGVRPDGCRAGKCSFLVMSISYGPFETTLDLPSGYDLGTAKAAYVNGFLRIDVPPLSTAKPVPSQIAIQGED